MKKILSFVLVFTLSFSAIASTGSLQSIEKAVDEYQYVLSVEWDQNDQQFRDQANREFSQKIRDILAKNAVSRDALLKIVEKKILSKEKLDALTVKIALLPKDLTEAQQISSLLGSLESGARGASWNGDVILGRTLAVILVSGMLLVIANSVQQGKCLERSTVLEESCSDGDCYEYYPCLQRENESWW